MRFTNTNWNFYRSFIGVYETGSINKAADMLNIKRETIGKAIKALEKQLGVTLFTSSTKGMTPTAQGKDLYEKVEPLTAAVVTMEKEIKTFDSSGKYVVRMGVPSTFVRVFLIDFIKNFVKRYPNVRFETYNRYGQEGLELLLQKRIDFLIDLEHIAKGSGLKVKPLTPQEFTFIASKEFLTERGLGTTITKEQLLELPLIGHREFLNLLKSESDLQFIPLCESATNEVVFSLTEKGVGIGYYLKSILVNHSSDIIEVKVLGVKPTSISPYCAYPEKSISSVAGVFLRELFEQIEND